MQLRQVKPLVGSAALLCLMFLLFGCAAEAPRTPSGVMDSPLHHFETGLRYLDDRDADRAGAEFELALSVDRDHAPSLAGKAVALAMRGQRDEALDLMSDALDLADDAGPQALAVVLPLSMRAHQALFQAGKEPLEDFLANVDDAFEDAVEADPADPEPYFRRGEMYLSILDFTVAEEMFRKAKALGRGYEDRATARWKLVQDAQRAAPGTSAGRRIALATALTRADMAALLVEELDIDSFYPRTGQSVSGGFVTPGAAQAQVALDVAGAVHDIAGHPLANDIRRALHHGVKGLEPFPDRTFRPDEPVSRAEAAMIFEDIVVRATGRRELATQFIGQDSRIPDLPGDHPAYNAAMVCITRGIMGTDVRTGLFRSLDTVSGVEALLAVKRLKTDLRLF